MHLLKIFGSLLIIASAASLGLVYSGRYKDRDRNLKLLYNCIQLLETEIIYLANPVPDALDEIYRKGNKKVSYIFREVKEYLVSNRGSSLLDSFQYVSNILKERMYLENEDIEVIMSLARSLGVSDRIDQQKHFKTALIRLEAQQREAHENKEKNVKLYKTLGVLLGITIALILY